MSGEIVIRTAVPADVDRLGDVFRRASLHNDGDRVALLEHPEALQFDGASVHDGRTRVAVDGDLVVGFATAVPNGDAFELDDLFVDPDWMRRGIALALVRDIEAIARRAGVRRVEVTANGHAMAFYLRAGFEAVGLVETELGSGTRMHLDVH